MHSDDEMVYLRDVVETLIYMTDEDSDGVEEVMQLPSIDIVRFGECKHENSCEHRVLLSTMWGEVEDTADIEYCSYGEREGE